VHWIRPHDPTVEDRQFRAKWVRGVAIFYGSAALLLLGLIAAQTLLAEPNRTTAGVSAGALAMPAMTATAAP
jgi:hypothetical protein